MFYPLQKSIKSGFFLSSFLIKLAGKGGRNEKKLLAELVKYMKNVFHI